MRNMTTESSVRETKISPLMPNYSATSTAVDSPFSPGRPWTTIPLTTLISLRHILES
ncbi:hypothetical protein BJY01DRAFT_218937 [Aspergillus pseudoustus]|uniref:Uncharacterized protein n=1 Tax=Aspergillus pseudoustus TaxID=1810923 RepID=A0ABR4JIP9_9EURO